MRKRWNRGNDLVKLNCAQLTELIQSEFPGDSAVAMEYASGGLCNTNVRVELKNHSQPVLVRLFVRDSAQAQKECSILKKLHGTVPVPQVFHFEEKNAITNHPAMIMEWIDDAARFENYTEEIAASDAKQVANSIGEALAAIHSFHFEQFGFLDGELKVAVPITMGGGGLLAYAQECLVEKGGADKLGAGLSTELLEFLQRRTGILDQWQGSPCLAHSDFGPSNILVRHAGNRWQVAAVLDWEFAFSGSPFFDFGNLLRSPVGDIPGFAETLSASYSSAGGSLPEDWLYMSKLVDLTAWLEFLTRPSAGSELIEDARNVVRGTISACKQS